MDKKILFETDNSSLWIINNFTKDYYNEIKDIELNSNPEFIMFGKSCSQHRDIGFYSNESTGYKYSTYIAKSFKMTETMNEIMDYINLKLDTNFNGILINRYKNGDDYISAHSDSKNGLSKDGIVAGISYGPAKRIFRIRDKKSNKIVFNYEHEPCTLIVMDGKFQDEFKHEIPVQKKIKDERISLTFRVHIN